MKHLLGIMFIVVLIIICANSIISCTKKESTSPIPFQGPQNQSFETSDFWYFSAYNAGFGYNSFTSSSIITGTGFLPSNGIRYASLTGKSSFSPAIATMYQDNVDFTHSTTMSFDYSFIATLAAGGVGGKATVQILFTSNGTETLWTKTIDNTNISPGQKINETITLPLTTSTGRLTFNVNAMSSSGVNGLIMLTSVAFGIDNINVK